MLRQRSSQICKRARRTSSVDVFNLLTSAQLLEVTEAHMPEHRERLYPPTVALSMFIRQVLDEDGSCQRAVNGWAAQRVAEGLSAHSVRTGAYCRARQRLPTPMVQALGRKTGALLCEYAAKGWRWRGRTVKLVDGTGVSMPDTAENQVRYPQPSTQAKGVGFPLIRLVGVICLSTGAILDAASSRFEGKGRGEMALIRRLLDVFERGDVMLADALYCSYWLVGTLIERGVDVVIEQHGSRRTDFRRGQRLASRDHIVAWRKPATRPKWMSSEVYRNFPKELIVREVEVDGRVLVTTMCKHRKVAKNELAELYERRWNVELDLRNIKTTLGMDVLRCLTPEMVEKELWVNLLAYNIIRLLMTQAALANDCHPRELSFKHTLQLWTQWTSHQVPVSATYDDLLRLIAQVVVGHRPGRIEPRARKRRPKPYPWLKRPRAVARQQIMTLGYLPNG
jgi:hypothetical protein